MRVYLLVCVIGFSSCGAPEISSGEPAGAIAPKDSVGAKDSTGWVSGVVRYSGRVPRGPMNNDGTRADLIEVDPAARGLRYALVYVTPKEGTASEVAPLSPTPPAEPALMRQVNFRFVPQVLVVAPGQRVRFTNDDPENHNVRAITETPGNAFNIITRPGEPYETNLRAGDETVPIRLACDFHSTMQAWIYVIDHANYAVTDEAGAFRIGPLPAGRYTLLIRQPASRLAAEAEIAVEPGMETVAETTFGLEHLQMQAMPEVSVATRPSEE